MLLLSIIKKVLGHGFLIVLFSFEILKHWLIWLYIYVFSIFSPLGSVIVDSQKMFHLDHLNEHANVHVQILFQSFSSNIFC